MCPLLYRNLKYVLSGLLVASLVAVFLTSSILFAQQGAPETPTPTLTPAPAYLPPLDTASPDQQPARVVYIQQGDLWVKTLPGGEPQRVTQNGTNYAPRWSPSGGYLAFLIDPSYPNVRVMRRDGGSVINFGGAVYDAHVWSPIEDRLAYDIGAEIWVSGMPVVRYADIPAPAETTGQIGKLAWSPDGQQIAFTWRAQQADGSIVKDGLWVVDVWVVEATGRKPLRLLEDNAPEAGEIILRGWSGDGKHLLYWQAPILSASISADGVPLYALPVDGGEPKLIADAVPVHDDAVQVQPGGEQIAVVVGGGRAVWTGKRVQLVSADATQPRVLSLTDQSAASPAWSPHGQQIAYVGMPDAGGAVAGGPAAQAALQQRRIWLADEQLGEPIPITGVAGTDEAPYRDEAPQWVDDDTLLFARLDVEGRLSLWTVDTDGTNLQRVVEDITPAPEWSGSYGYIDWSPVFALWRPAMAEGMMARMAAQAMRPYAFPSGIQGRGHALAPFLERMHQNLTQEEMRSVWGEPEMAIGTQDVSTGDRMFIYQYALDDELKIRLGFPDDGPLAFVQVQHLSGRVFALTPLEGLVAPAVGAAIPMPPSLFGTATPTPTPMQSPLATPTPR
jgi:Tol biopolymer transport system component